LTPTDPGWNAKVPNGVCVYVDGNRHMIVPNGYRLRVNQSETMVSQSRKHKPSKSDWSVA
jgi:hypothetical protein